MRVCLWQARWFPTIEAAAWPKRQNLRPCLASTQEALVLS